jgi:hypothetical protein
MPWFGVRRPASTGARSVALGGASGDRLRCAWPVEDIVPPLISLIFARIPCVPPRLSRGRRRPIIYDSEEHERETAEGLTEVY